MKFKETLVLLLFLSAALVVQASTGGVLLQLLSGDNSQAKSAMYADLGNSTSSDTNSTEADSTSSDDNSTDTNSTSSDDNATPVLHTYLRLENNCTYDIENVQVRIDISSIDYPFTLEYNGTTVDYCFEEPLGTCSNVPTNIIWIKTPLIPAKSSIDILVSEASDYNPSSASLIFDLYDEFDSLADWNASSGIGPYIIDSGQLKMSENWGTCNTGVCFYPGLNYSNSTFGISDQYGLEILFRHKQDPVGDYTWATGVTISLKNYVAIVSNPYGINYRIEPNDYAFYGADSDGNPVYPPSTSNTYEITKITLKVGEKIKVEYAGDEMISPDEVLYSFSDATFSISGDTDGEDIFDYLDWIRVRKIPQYEITSTFVTY